MKNCILAGLLIFSTICFAQVKKKTQVSKKDVKSGLVTFESFTNDKGDVSYGFRIGGLIVGPNMVLQSDGKTTYVHYNKNNVMDGTLIEMDKQSGTVSLFTYRDGLKDGPAIIVANGQPKAEQYKKGKIDLKGFKVDPPGKYALIKGDGKSGFTMEKYDKSYALGYFIHGYRHTPMIHVWNDGDSYYGQYLFGKRIGFGVFFGVEGNKYVGMWDDNYREGLGFKLDKEGNITEKGYYDDGELILPL